MKTIMDQISIWGSLPNHNEIGTFRKKELWKKLKGSELIKRECVVLHQTTRNLTQF